MNETQTQTPAPQTPAAAEPSAHAPSLARTVEFVFDNDDVDSAVTAKLQNAGRNANIKGFRPGKAPLSILRQRFGGEFLREELINRAAKKFNETQSEPGAEKAATSPQLTAVTTQQRYAVECRYEAIPEIAAPDFKGQKLMRPTLTVGDADVGKMVEKLRADSGQYVEVRRASADGDMITVDYELTEDGEVREKAEGRKWLLGGGLLGDDTNQTLVGANVGDVRDITMPPPATPAGAQGEAAAKESVLRVTIRAVSELHKAEMNDALFARYGITQGGEEAFRKGVREMLEVQVARRLREVLSARAMDCLYAATPQFDLPRTMIQNEILGLWQERVMELKQMGMGAAAGKVMPMTFAPAATRRVAMGLLLAEWRNRENINITDEDAESRLDELAREYESPDEFRVRIRNNPREWETLKLAILEERAVEWICQQAQTEDQPVTLEQLLG